MHNYLHSYIKQAKVMRIKFLSMFCILILSFSSCSNNNFYETETEETIEMSDVEVKFGTSIGVSVEPSLLQRAPISLGSSVGLYMIKSENPQNFNIINGYANKAFVSTGLGTTLGYSTLVPSGTANKMYYPASLKVKFAGYSPYSTSGLQDFKVDVSNQLAVAGIDLTYGITEEYDKHTPIVLIKLEHQLCMLKITIKASDPDLDVTKVKLTGKNLLRKATFDYANAKFTPSTEPDAIGDIANNSGAAMRTFLCIPQKLDTDNKDETKINYFEFEIDGDIYKWNPKNVTSGNSLTVLEKGKIYDYTITIDKPKKIILAEGLVAGWASEEAVSVEAN